MHSWRQLPLHPARQSRSSRFGRCGCVRAACAVSLCSFCPGREQSARAQRLPPRIESILGASSVRPQDHLSEAVRRPHLLMSEVGRGRTTRGRARTTPVARAWMLLRGVGARCFERSRRIVAACALSLCCSSLCGPASTRAQHLPRCFRQAACSVRAHTQLESYLYATRRRRRRRPAPTACASWTREPSAEQ